ncbi:hypothetical protein TEA_015069 [Camellia sinensis var. sinensis]|uniref:Uncharacterized protein n=1 Tax=Camellia sinensis var. sinensis TaxID=542762 RepID=A0A4S4DY98_CAMSN|nr:hypothetical protein TEA_015069 [Camellia sinensis var. sinensis]
MKNKAKCPLKLHTFKLIFNLLIIIHTQSHQQSKQDLYGSVLPEPPAKEKEPMLRRRRRIYGGGRSAEEEQDDGGGRGGGGGVMGLNVNICIYIFFPCDAACQLSRKFSSFCCGGGGGSMVVDAARRRSKMMEVAEAAAVVSWA